MKMKKYALALVFAFLCVLGMPKEVMAEGGSCGTNVNWWYEDGVLTIGGSGTVDERPWMDSHKEDITKVVIQEGVTQIKVENAFQDCINVSSISLPNSLTYLGYNAFSGCTSLTDVTIPKNLTECGGHCFKDTSVKTVTFEEGLTVVPEKLFMGCKTLTTVNFSSTIKEIENSAFQDCTSLTQMNLPQSITTLGYCAFSGCTALTEVTIPKTLTECGGHCFKDTGVKTVTFEEGITIVPEKLFSQCKTLVTINFCNTIKELKDSAFQDCTSLAQISLPSSLTSLGYYVFAGCTSLDEVIIPKTVTECRGYCFKDSGVKTVTFEEGATIVPEGLMRQAKNLTTVNFVQSITQIGNSAFQDCIALEKVVLPWYLEKLNYYVFSGCTSLKDVTIYQNVTEINNYTFFRLEGLTIRGKKNSYAHKFAKEKGYTFQTCKIPALKGITYTKGNVKYQVINDYIDGKGTVMVTGMKKNAASVTIPKTVKLESYTYKVVKINNNAFKNKSKLKKITVKSTYITSVGKNAFKGINKKATIKVPKSKLKDYKKMFTKKKTGYKKTMKITK